MVLHDSVQDLRACICVNDLGMSNLGLTLALVDGNGINRGFCSYSV